MKNENILCIFSTYITKEIVQSYKCMYALIRTPKSSKFELRQRWFWMETDAPATLIIF
jgi:hypothetical protein